jgi:hypothetical protein
VDKFFILENDNADTSQRNVVFISRGECGRHAETIAGLWLPLHSEKRNLTLTQPRSSASSAKAKQDTSFTYFGSRAEPSYPISFLKVPVFWAMSIFPNCRFPFFL